MKMTVKKRPSDLTSLERFNLYYREKEEPLPKGERIKKYIWNPKTREFCGRTGSSWSKIATFYIVFYLVLAIIVAICMWTFLQTLDARQPRWQMESSIIGTNPGLGFRPMPPEVASSVIWYRGNDPGSYQFWVRELSNFLKTYKRDANKSIAGQNIHNCDFKLPPPAGKVCDVDVNAWGPCTEENGFAYHMSTPCIFLKLNKIFGWKPEFYNSSDNLPAAMPEDLKEHIRNMTAYDKNYLNMVWVSCQGENPADRENIGPIQYLPYRGFPGYYFPYTNQEGYISPLVAVHLQRPKTGMLINIECRAWSHNIKYDRGEGMGSVHIEIMVE
ncbi:sodium/potassium-transporting ATPase subunit beta-2-like isoform X1 [Aricia agestis]|uniref:sodium/potassium-transporting ATPase subunit beta-2-like isoform X1 n=2 Tax=Aricia agestis TaxID=91739 RepID=UPI001C202FC1|nr:sodium/potassium-transporting ATPase subunit beta-2-like isoform X1 [Aricia agestis]